MLVAASGAGVALVLDEPLSFWGGLDAGSGTIIDARHPQRGEIVVGRILVMPSGRGSSSSSSVLAEAIRGGTGPAALVLAEPDEIVVLGALVVSILDGTACPVAVLAPEDYRRLRSGDSVSVDTEGSIEVHAAGADAG
ncbi:DUF126 domain-containing protein [soil metagenome]